MKNPLLHLPIINLVTTDCPVIEMEANPQDALRLFSEHHLAALPVVEGEVFKGLLYKQDLFEKFQPGKHVQLRKWVSRNAVFLSPEDSVKDAIEVFKSGGFDSIPVVWAGGYFAGMLLREVLKRYVPF